MKTRTELMTYIKRMGVVLVIFLLCLMVYTAVYCSKLSKKIENRFSSRRWSIPSKIYSDTTLLYPGQSLNRQIFFEKLVHLGYKKVSFYPQKKGQMQILLNHLNI